MKSLLTALFALLMLASTYVLAGDVEAGRVKSAMCSSCHGVKGISMSPLWPNLAGQKEQYLIKQIKAFRDLISDTIGQLQGAFGQGALASAAGAAATRWDPVDGDFAALLRKVQSQAWSMPYDQVKPVVEAVVGHLNEQLPAIDQQLNG